MIKSKEELKDFLRYEKNKYGFSGCTEMICKYLLGSEKAVIWNYQRRLRITEYHKNCNHNIRYSISRVLLNHKSNKYGLRISINTFGRGLKIMHLGPILINGSARIGEDCAMHINTAIVARGNNNGVPVLGNNIVIGVGAVLLGQIEIADGIVIGANALVNRSFIEPNVTIAGVPARKISDNGKATWNKHIGEE